MKTKFTKSLMALSLFAVLFGFAVPNYDTNSTVNYVKTEPGDSH